MNSINILKATLKETDRDSRSSSQLMGDEVGTDEPSLSVALHHVARRVRALRKARGLTLEDVGKASGVSIGSLSQLERGKGNPSFNSLVRLSHALGVPVAQLLHDASPDSPVVRAHERRSLDFHNAGGSPEATHELLTPDGNRSMEAMWIEAPPGYTTEDAPFSHPGEEAVIILKGQHEIHLGNETYVLEAGDSISYPSSVPHWYRNLGTETVTAIWIMTPPTS